jgi:hypothetical protein
VLEGLELAVAVLLLGYLVHGVVARGLDHRAEHVGTVRIVVVLDLRDDGGDRPAQQR